MSKGSGSRPYSVTRDEFASKFDAIDWPSKRKPAPEPAEKPQEGAGEANDCGDGEAA